MHTTTYHDPGAIGGERTRTAALCDSTPDDIRDILAAGGPHYDGDTDALASALEDHGLLPDEWVVS